MKKPSLLIIDDAPDVADMLATCLRLSGYDVRAVCSSWDGLNVARGEQFDVVILDIGMPGMDGYELVRELRNMLHYRDVPIISMTGFPIYDDKRSLEAGFDAHIAKPLDPDNLINIINTIRGDDSAAS